MDDVSAVEIIPEPFEEGDGIRVVETPSGRRSVRVDGQVWIGDPRDARAPVLSLVFDDLEDASSPSLTGMVVGLELQGVSDEALLLAFEQAQVHAARQESLEQEREGRRG